MLKVKKLDPAAKLPTVAHPNEDLAYDLYALEDTILKFGVVTKVRTGIAAQAFEVTRTIRDTGFLDSRVGPPEVICVRHKPLGLLIRDRSSMASKGIVVSGGVLDSGYTGEISVLMTNNDPSHVLIYKFRGAHIPEGESYKAYQISAGGKIAQMIPLPVLTGEVVEVEELGESSRGANGFGSSGQ